MSNHDFTPIEFFLLTCLLTGEHHGRELCKKASGARGRQYAYGTIYAALDGLEERGYVASRYGETTPERAGNRRKYFALTEHGKKMLAEFAAGDRYAVANRPAEHETI